MFDKIIAFFMSIIMFFMQLFGLVSDPSIIAAENVSYGSHERQVVDIYLPAESDGSVGLFVFIHGGGWVGGDKSSYTDACKNAVKQFGIAAITLNYRYISDDTHCDEMLDDITAAMTKAVEFAKENGIELDAAAFTGHSAGGHLSLLYAYKCADISPVPVVFTFTQAGPADMNDPAFYKNNGLGDATVLELASKLSGVPVDGANFDEDTVKAALAYVSPVTYVNEKSVPTLIAHGDVDDIVPYSNAVTLAAVLDAAGVSYDMYTYKNTGHGLDNDKETHDACYEKLYEYIRLYLQ